MTQALSTHDPGTFVLGARLVESGHFAAPACPCQFGHRALETLVLGAQSFHLILWHFFVFDLLRLMQIVSSF